MASIGSKRSGNARDPALIDCRRVVPLVVIVGAIDLPVDGIGAGAIYRARRVYARIQLQ